MNTLPLGRFGEQVAADFLQKQGYIILARHFTTHWGELDIVGKKENTIVFVEVKTRASDRKGHPWEAITYHKRKALDRCIKHYLLQNKLFSYKLSVDVVTVEVDMGKQIHSIKHYRNAYTPQFSFYP